MSIEHWSLSDSPFDHMDWPETGHVALMLDGVAIPELGSRICHWAKNQETDTHCLYQNTRWEVVSDLSPWLIWLAGPQDPVLHAFLADGAQDERGYLVTSSLPPTALLRCMRGWIQVERAPGHPELMRIAHPELARSLIGGGLLGSVSDSAIAALITPDLTRSQWVVQKPCGGGTFSDARGDDTGCGTVTGSPALEEAFEAFNRRRDNLLIWRNLDDQARNWLGGPSLEDAYSELCDILRQSEIDGCESLRDKARYLLGVMARNPSGIRTRISGTGFTQTEHHG